MRGLGETFAANPVTGTGAMTVPIETSPGRSGFGPQLALAYDSGSGNGLFGFGWSLSLPAITRKTDKGLPQYLDAEESDIYILSGMEDLVPVLNPNGTRFEDPATDPGYVIHRYRPRVEGLFARIERWTHSTTGEIHWRSISDDNVTTVYGKDSSSRIHDPTDPSSSGRIFSWLISESYDDVGNAIVYQYVEENGNNVDLTQANERNRVRTANRYLKRIKYGNRVSRWIEPDLNLAEWLFEVVFDYNEGHYQEVPLNPNQPEEEQHRFSRASSESPGQWTVRPDPFSSYRSGFEIRTYRRCRRILMFHHFDELGTEPCLVRSTHFNYADFENSPSSSVEEELAHQGSTRIASVLRSITQCGHVRDPSAPTVEEQGISYATYLEKSLPALGFEYSKARLEDEVHELDRSSRENLPAGLDGNTYQWVDLDGEGISGILSEQAGAWFYKPNLGDGRFGALQTIPTKPSVANLGSGRQQLIDLAGDGHLDLVDFTGSAPGFYERTPEESWDTFRPFGQLPNIKWNEPNLRFIDLNGDGHADVLITEHEVLTWYPSLKEAGFDSARHVRKPWDEEAGPRLVFADGEQSIYLADMSGDGLTDLVRVRNGEVCYWPNHGAGRFGGKVTMDDAPSFDHSDQFDQRRVRLVDVDGSGTNDLLYLAPDGAHLYFNLAGNGWSTVRRLKSFPRFDDFSSVTTVDLKGSGTVCLVWSSPLPGGAWSPLRYIDLMGSQKPHLLIKSMNNLGAETRIEYAPSTKFYIADKAAGKPWLTRIPFPVHVVERVETLDHIGRNRFLTRYAYHHGNFDSREREFRGFGMVEQWDAEEFGAWTEDESLPTTPAHEAAAHVPPVYTKTWFHTGAYLGRERISNFFAGMLNPQDSGEYFREPGLSDAEVQALLLPDTPLPPSLTHHEEQEACRALQGAMLRQEIYAVDGTLKAEFPYTVIEQNFTVRLLQARAQNRHGVFFAQPREALTFHYERNPTDPRIEHHLTLQVDDFANVLKEATIAYGRRQPDAALPLSSDRARQTKTLVTYSEHRVTNAIDDATAHRTPMPCETRTYELTGLAPEGNAIRFRFDEWTRNDFALPQGAAEISYEQTADDLTTQKRLLECVRTLYRKDDLSALLPLATAEPLALEGESYQLALTPGLVAQVYERDGVNLLPNPADVLSGATAGRGGYVPSQDLKAAGHFPNTDPDDHWWIPSGRTFLSPQSTHTAPQERAYAQNHFFLPHRERDPFHTAAVSTESSVRYDAYDLLVLESHDALNNRVTVGGRLPNGDLDSTQPGYDYRVLQPVQVMDPNRNRTQAAFDALGMVVATAVLGKPEENLGDELLGFETNLTAATQAAHLADPLNAPQDLLGRASTRLVYDLFAYQRGKDQPNPPPTVLYTVVRESHHRSLEPGQQTKFQHHFSYSDGFGREIQQKVRAEPGPLVDGGAPADPRWVGSGWTLYNNKGLPIRQYEPFMSATHRFEFAVQVGVSPTLFYDPTGRAVATLYPNHTYQKVIFDPWKQVTWDVNDTVLNDPRTDQDILGLTAGYFAGLPANPPWQTWYEERQGGALGPQEQGAAQRTAPHADTPSAVYFDTLGRPFLTLADHGPDPDQPAQHLRFATRVELDIEGNELSVRDAIEQDGDAAGRLIIRYAYDMLGHRIHQESMEAGARWTLYDVADQTIWSWDRRGHAVRTEHDPLRRPLRSIIRGALLANPAQEVVSERYVYGEQHPEAEQRNLRGELYLQLDQAGAVATEVYDFKGNPLRATRRIASEYKQAVSWSDVDAALPNQAQTPLDAAALEAVLGPLLEQETYTTLTTLDALNRPLTLTTPHTSAMQPNVLRPRYNEANLLEGVDANLQGASANGQPVWTPFVTNIDYDAKGQRQRIDYGNGTSTLYQYDPLTFRLTHLLTRRDAVLFPGDCPQPSPPGWAGCQVQNLSYTYDPVGNITHLRDNAQQTVYFRNKRVEPSVEYHYDAVYRLQQATGREHLGQNGAPQVHSSNDALRVGIPWAANDGNAMGTYTENYSYDAVGNLLQMQHSGSDPAHPGWTRTYAYEEASPFEPAKRSNRLSHTTVGGGSAERYVYDAHGNMVRIPHLGGAHPTPNIHWDPWDRLVRTDLGGGGTAYATYDASGQRVRKVWEKSAQHTEERIYLGGLEIFRRRQGGERFERQTLHIMDDEQRIGLVETRTVDTAGTDTSPAQLIRYQLSNHLDSANLELDDQAQLVSYEEYTPFGSTSYQAVRSQTETPKRYRFSGKERDQESGLYFHGARYYAPWLGRWLSCDPAQFVDGTNLYAYVGNNPTRFNDPSGMGAKEQSLGAKMEAASKKHQDLANKRRAQKGLKKIPVDRQVRVGDKKVVIPDEVKTTPGGKNTVVDTKARHVNSKRNSTPGSRRADVKESLEQVKKQLAELEKAKKVDASAKGKVLRVLHDSDKGQTSTKELTKWKLEAKDVRKEWVDAAPNAKEKALRNRVNVTSTTRDRFKKATDALQEIVKKNKKAVKVVKSLGKAGRHFAAAVPVAGIVIGQSSAAHAASQGDFTGAALDEAGFIPVAGDLLDAFRGGLALGEAATEVLPIEEGAISTGQEAEKAAKSLGASDDVARVVGATGAALGAINEFAQWTNPVTAVMKLPSLF